MNVAGLPQTTSVLLSWMQSDLDIVNYYVITFNRITGCSNATSGIMNVSGLLKNYNLTGLEEAITYSIIISAANIRGLSSSTAIEVTTSAAGKLHI